MLAIDSVLSTGTLTSARSQAIVGPFEASVVGTFTADKIVLKRKYVGDDDSIAQVVQTWYDAFSVNGLANGGDKWEYWFEATNLTDGTPKVRVALPDNRYR